MTVPGRILIVAPDPGLLRSLEFALEVEGFVVRSYQHLATAIMAPHAGEVACVLIDEDAILEDPVALAACQRSSKPTLLLVDGSHPLPEMAGVRILQKPMLGNALIKAVRLAAGISEQGQST